MRIDTCSNVNIIDEYSFNKITNSVKLKNKQILDINARVIENYDKL